MSTGSTSAGALAVVTATTPRALVDDPLALDADALGAIASSLDKTALVVGVVTGGAAAALCAALTALNPVAAWAMVPAFLAGFAASTRVVDNQAAAAHGVTPRCFAVVKRAIGQAVTRRDLRAMTRREWIKTDYLIIGQLVHERLRQDPTVTSARNR